MLLLVLTLACDPDGEKQREAILTADADADGFSIEEGDCNDTLPLVNPGQEELCDGLDNDCDTQVDEGTEHLWYLDNDDDGYGNPETVVDSCSQPAGYIPTGGDCDDNHPDIAPGATERCDEVDEDCDGQVDEEVETHWFLDEDQDGYGDPTEAWLGCDPPQGYVDNDFDCDDGDDRMNALADDICDEVDNDCDGQLDEDPDILYFADSDVDGFGDPTDSAASCEPVAGRVLDDNDCDDQAPGVFPGASEYCNELDDDCDDSVDEGEAVDALRWNLDADEDGYGGPTEIKACSAPTGYVGDDSDCDDGDGAVHPGADEYCNDSDDDCDQSVDESGAADETTFYVDFDGDGYGDVSFPQDACEAPPGYVADATDCDDSTDAVNPGETESCDGMDNDCDGDEDEAGSIGESTWYVDDDGDGYGDTSNSSTACDKPGDSVDNDEDCDDASAAISPDATEICDSADNDCDGTVDENDADDATDWFLDSDGDGYGDKSTKLHACDQPSGYVDSDKDCDDGDSSAHPGASETWYDGIDSDCLGDDDYDADADGYQSDQYGGLDCDDSDGAISPSATEVCDDGIDDDCTGVADDGCAEQHCNDITSNETWAAGDHEVTCSFDIHGGAALTIQAGATVYMNSGTSISVGGSGSGELYADAASSSAITFTSVAILDGNSPLAGDWDAIYLGAGHTGQTTFNNVLIEYGGTGDACLDIDSSVSVDFIDLTVLNCQNAGVIVSGSGNPSFDNAYLASNGTMGLRVEDNAGLNGFSGTVTGNGAYPVSLPTKVADKLDATSSSYLGNGSDQIELRGGTIDGATTLTALDVDYRMTASTKIEGSGGANLTLQGVTVEMASGVNIKVGQTSPGDLVILTSTVTPAKANPSNGEWGALQFGTSTSSLSTIDNSTIEYGGGHGANGMIECEGASATVSGSTIQNSGSWGIYTSQTCGMTLTNNTYVSNTGGDVNF